MIATVLIVVSVIMTLVMIGGNKRDNEIDEELNDHRRDMSEREVISALGSGSHAHQLWLQLHGK